ncbi:MAG: transposase [Proteobacteria bacterium]|nr:transposase [Pseudomonadota bacterium]
MFHVPISHPFVTRLIGTIRREFRDHVLFWTSHDLERKLSEFTVYFNRHRVHSSLSCDDSAELAVEVQNPFVRSW